ncbi:hypothetical protein FO519_008438 [Halicephalobus sp. NKZ332]|nr:hypothetical protein FO519_008438 [Halicephalobus sp. NKZ332]
MMKGERTRPPSKECQPLIPTSQRADTENININNNLNMEDFNQQSTSYFRKPVDLEKKNLDFTKKISPVKFVFKKDVFVKKELLESPEFCGSRSPEGRSPDVSRISNYETHHVSARNLTSPKDLAPRAIPKILYPPVSRQERDYSKERARKFEKFRLIQPWSTKPTHLEPVPDHLWILPCNSDNTLKDTLFIVSDVDHHRGCRFVLQGKSSQNQYVFSCTNCHNRQRKPQYAIVQYQHGQIHVDAQSDHVMGCFRLDLRRALSSETGVLTNF